MTPETCPNCGADVPHGARACPECGSDENTGWSGRSAHAHPEGDEAFDYEQFVEREFGSTGAAPPGIHWFWWVTGILLTLAMARFLIL